MRRPSIRRYIMLWVLAALGALPIAGAQTTAAENVIVLKLAHFMPTLHVQHREAFVPFAEAVAEKTQGRVRIDIFPGGALGNPKNMVDVVATGIADIGFVLPSYVPGRFPRSSVFELPFIFDSAAGVAKAFYDNYALLVKDYKRFKPLWFLSSPLSQVHTVEKPILAVDDFVDMKIRSASVIETVGIRQLGGNPIGMPISELSFALQRGTVEGALTPYAALKSHKLIDIVEHITEINYSGALMAVLMNKGKWESLPDFAKTAIGDVANREFGMMAAKAFDKEDRESIAAGKAKGIAFHALPPAETVRMQEMLRGTWEDWVIQNENRFPARDLLDGVLESADNR